MTSKREVKRLRKTAMSRSCPKHVKNKWMAVWNEKIVCVWCELEKV
jgi:hypothetical protein